MFRNAVKTVVLLAAIGALFMVVGSFFGPRGLVIGLVLGLVFVGGSYWFSDKLAVRAAGAKPVTEAEAPQLYAIVRDLTSRTGLPMPAIYISPAAQPNAFATGRNPQHAAVAVTQGLMRVVDEDELRGVLAHELSHVRNRDTLISAIAATLAGVVLMAARMAQWAALFGGLRRDEREEGEGALGFIFLVVLAPLAAMLIQLAISRAREYQADASGAELSHAPRSLASALEKIGAVSGRIPLSAGPATAHLWIVNPLRGNWLARLFSTHPPIEERIRRLRAMAY